MDPRTSPTADEVRLVEPSTARLPVGVYLLAFSLFAMGSAEFLLAGVLPAVADDLHVSLSSAGFLITAFALGVVLGGPPFAVLSLRWPRRTALMATQAVFAVSVAAGLLGDYQVLLVSRVVSGVAYAGFFAVASVTAISLVTPDRNARASGVVVSGLSVAMVAGGPAGTLLSHFTEWRGGFWAVVALTLAGIVACSLGIPAVKTGSRRPSVSRELVTLRTPRLWGIYGITILTTAAYMITFNYLSAMLAEITGVPTVWIPAILALFGVGAFVGLSIGGRVSDQPARRAPEQGCRDRGSFGDSGLHDPPLVGGDSRGVPARNRGFRSESRDLRPGLRHCDRRADARRGDHSVGLPAGDQCHSGPGRSRAPKAVPSPGSASSEPC